MVYNKPQEMTLMGSKTPQTVIYKSESHKLCQAFPIKEGVTIVQGMPVQLETDGSISPYAGTGVYLGIAITDSLTPAYPPVYPVDSNTQPEVTVMVEAYAIVYGLSSAALDAGPVAPQEYDPESGNQYITYATDSAEAHPKFISINKVAEANALIQVLIR